MLVQLRVLRVQEVEGGRCSGAVALDFAGMTSPVRQQVSWWEQQQVPVDALLAH